MSRFDDGTLFPEFADDIETQSITSADFSPIEDASLTASEIGRYTDKGFLVRALADGNAYVITLRQYKNNNNSLTGLVPHGVIPMSANTWLECRVVKVYADDDATYPSTIGDASGYVNIGIIN